MQLLIKLHRIVKHKKAAGEFIPTHEHPFYHSIYVLNGIGIIELGDRSLKATKGMFICIPPHQQHAIYGIDNFQSFDIKFTAKGPLSDELKHLPDTTLLNSSEEAIILNIFHLAIISDLYTEDIVNIKMTELMLYLLRKIKRSSAAADSAASLIADLSSSSALAPALFYLHSSPAQSPSIAELAGLCGYHPAYFSTMFKKKVGCTPSHYLSLRKIEKAKELMLTTSLNITQIADSLNQDLAGFSKLFKKTVGLSPSTYYNRASYDRGINVSKTSPYAVDADFEIQKQKTDKQI